MEHLALEIFDISGSGSAFATLEDDASITITDTSEVFAKGDLWSYSFTLNVRANAGIFGSAGDIHGARLHEQLDRRRARLWADGIPMYLGYLRLGSEADAGEDGNVDVTFEAGQKTFDDLIDGAKANQVPMMSDVLIGLALWRKRTTSVTLRLKATPVFKYKNDEDYSFLAESSDVFYQTDPHTGTRGQDVPFGADGEAENVSVQEYPRMVFPRLPEGTFEDLSSEGLTEVDCINTDHPYDDSHPYCNVALCYQRYGYEKKDTAGNVTTDYGSEPEAQRGYEYMPADRLNSAPNFYVIYWIRALMKHLGIHIEENQMMDVEDLRRLFFVNTDCAYYEPKTLRSASAGTRYGKYRFRYDGRNIHRLVPEYFGERLTEDFHGQEIYAYRRGQNINTENSAFRVTDYRKVEGDWPEGWPELDYVKLTVDSVGDWDDQERERYERENGYLHRAFATSECFPDADISEVIKAIEAGFGIRFLFSSDYKRVRIVLLRNIFRSKDVQDVACDVVSRHKTENSVRGFRMTYGDIDDTQFHYKGFDDLLPKRAELWKDDSDKHDYSHWKLDAAYADIIKRVSAFDKTCYVTPETGDAYGIKIDKDAKRYEELHPSLFEYAGFMDALDGDCTGEEETIETVTVPFKPAIMNDLNMEAERNGKTSQRFALFIDGEMRPRRPDLHGKDSPYNASASDYPIYGTGGLYDDSEEAAARGMRGDDGIVKPGEFAITSDMFATMDGYLLRTTIRGKELWLFDWDLMTIDMNIDGHISEGYRLYLQDNYTPNDGGVSPVESHDWGLTLGIMRGSGDDAHVRYEGDPDDGEGNDTWERVAGSSVTAHPDTCDSYGNEWDYNGTSSGIGPDGRISLKLRAEKPNPEFDASQPESDANRRYLKIDKERLRGRGLCDQFYKEYSYWVRNARISHFEARMELAQLLTIDKTKMVRVGDVTGFIRKMQYTISNRTGLGMVKMEIMYI